MYRRFAPKALICVLLAACGGEGGSASGPGGGDGGLGGSVSGLTFQRDVRPLIEAHCSSCHQPGGIGPFVLGYDPEEWKDGTPTWAAGAVAAVESRHMPPWKPDPACREYDHSRRLSDEQVAVFSAWRDAGFQLGDEADYKAPQLEQSGLGEPTLTLMPAEPYTPSITSKDDYRCFLLPGTFDEESYLVGTDVQPGARRHVHHVILYTVDQASVAETEALDAAEPGPGYTCYGGPGVGGSQNVGGWVPGMVPSVTPEDSARVIKKGTRLIMQIHYNTSAVAEGEKPDEDLTGARLWLLPEGKVPSYRITTVPLANTDILIKAGDPESTQVKTFNVPASGTIVGVLPHMHTLGARIEVVREADEACLVRIPEWDFHWQQGYRFAKDAFLDVTSGDRLTLTCVYDNSGAASHADHSDAADHTEPVDVRWGEGTADEMCLNYIELRTPFGRSLKDACPDYRSCLAACDEGDTLCIAKCGNTTESCRECVTAGLTACAPGRCEAEGLALQSCRSMCGQDCAASTCLPQVQAFFLCMEPSLRDGSCDPVLDTCGG